MTTKKIDRNKVENVFAEYTAAYNAEDVKIKLKIDHTYRVAAIADKIAKSLKLSDEDVDIAWLLGMLHDIGRFEQLRRYNTFIDSVSVNHAAFSADILFIHKDIDDMDSMPMIREFIDDIGEDVVIEKAIRLHNVFKLPEALTDREEMFANILRDADKIDILKVNCDIPMEEIYDRPLEDFKKDFISPLVYEDAMGSGNVDRRHVETAVDSLVTKISFVYGLVFPESFREVVRQGYLEQMLEFESENPDTQEKLRNIGCNVRKYIENNIKETI